MPICKIEGAKRERRDQGKEGEGSHKEIREPDELCVDEAIALEVAWLTKHNVFLRALFIELSEGEGVHVGSIRTS